VAVFEDAFTVDAPADAVWDFLLDPARLAACIPGCESLEVEDATTYRVRLTVKVGFLSTTQEMRMTITEADRPRHLVAVGRGEDRKLASHVEVRNTLDLAAIPTLKELSHLPVIVDPSHATGKWTLVAPMSKAAVAAGADGLLIEVHSNPECALCDGEESIKPSKFKALMYDLGNIAKAVGREI